MAKTNGSAQNGSAVPSYDFGFGDMSRFMPGSNALPNMDAMMQVHRQNAQAFTEASQRAMEAMQAVMRRQNEMVRDSWKDTTDMFGEVMSAATPEQKMAKQTEITKSAIEKAMSNGRELAEMVTRSNLETAEAFGNCFNEAMDHLRSACAKR